MRLERAEAPEDLTSEQKLVGSALLAPSNLPSIMGMVQPNEFYHRGPQGVYSAICDLALEAAPISVSTVAAKAHLDIAEVSEFTSGVDPSEWEFWAHQVHRYARKRHLYNIALDAQALALAEEDPETAINRIQSRLSEDSYDNLGITALGEAMDSVLEDLTAYVSGTKETGGLATGWNWFDRVLDGLMPGALITVYAPTSQFKSMFVQNIAWRLSAEGTPGLMFTTEMPRKQVLMRLLQLESGMNIRQMRYHRTLGNHIGEIREHARDLQSYPLWICDRSVADIGYLSALTLRAKQTKNIEYVIVDLVDHVRSSAYRDDPIKNESYIMQQLKDLAKRCEIPIICTSHIRKMDLDAKKNPRSVIDVDDIKGSSSKSQDSDVAISLVQCAQRLNDMDPWIPANRDQRLASLREGIAYLMCGITKNRDGELADIPFMVLLDEGGRMVPHEDILDISPSLL